MRLGAFVIVVGLLCLSLACGRGAGGFFRQYEYEEEMYLSLDGTATLYVNSSVAALNALRGTSMDARPNARIDHDAVRSYFTSAVTHVTRVTTSRRNNRVFVHVRMEVDNVRRLKNVTPFAWSTYDFAQSGHLFVYRQTVGPAASGNPANVNWTGQELTAFRLHLPSRIRYHSALEEGRGNILVWEQPLRDRVRGVPVELEARMDPESILYRTLWLFGATFLAVAFSFVMVIWWVFRRGARTAPASAYAGRRA